MIPHTQQIMADPARGDGYDKDGRAGDCWRTCIASILDLPAEDVPNFADANDDQWWAETQAFIETTLGAEYGMWYWPKLSEVPLEKVETGHLIISGPSPRGNFHHAVVGDLAGRIVHDPHPSRAGLAGKDWFYNAIIRTPRVPRVTVGAAGSIRIDYDNG
jgi:hypothetical protein